LVLAGRYLLVALLIVDSFCRCCSPSIKTRRRLHPNPNVAHMTHKKFPHQQQRSPPVLRLQMDVGPDESWDSNPSLRPPLEDTLIKTLPNPGSLPRHTCGTSLSRRSDPKCPLRSHTQSVEVQKNRKIGNRNSTENSQCMYVSMFCLFFQMFDEQIIDLLVCRRCRREPSTLEISYWERLLTVRNSGRAFVKGFLASASLSVCVYF
jgi:hypothetical protein